MTFAVATLTPAIVGGAAIGSFMTVLAARVPPLLLSSADGRVRLASLIAAISFPRSHCTTCSAPLRWRDNIPLFSYLLLRGRCHSCHESFSPRYFWLEVGGALAGTISVHSFGWSVQAALCFLLLSLLLLLSAIDLAELLLPDILVLPLLPAGLAWQWLYGAGIVNGLEGAIAAFTAMSATAAIYRLARQQDGLGGGDVKLAGALGAWLGLFYVPFFLIGAFAACLLVMSLWLFLQRRGAQTPLPLGPFLALSAGALVLAPGIGALLASLITP